MSRNNPKAVLRIINAKLASPFTCVKTPAHRNSALSERIVNIASSPNPKHSTTERKVVSINLKKQDRKQLIDADPAKHKKVLKLRRKTESADKMVSSPEHEALKFCSSQARIHRNGSTNLLISDLRCFDQINSEELVLQCDGRNLVKPAQENEANWEQVVQAKKQKLYSQIYKMDKKLFSFQRDMDRIAEMTDKKTIMEIVKRKTAMDKSRNFQGGHQEISISPIRIHTNIYKMGKNRIS